MQPKHMSRLATAYSPLALLTTGTTHHQHYSPLALLTTGTTHHWHYSPPALLTTGTTHHWHYSPLATAYSPPATKQWRGSTRWMWAGHV